MGKRKEIDLNKMKSLYNQGLSDSEIAKELGCNRELIKSRRKELGLPANYWKSPIWIHADEIKQLFAEGKSSAEISKIYHVSTCTLAKFKKQFNIKGAFDMKMFPEDIEKAMEMAKEGLMDTEIAKKFGVTNGDISYLRKSRGIKSQFTYDKISKIDNKKFEKLFNQGLGDKEIGEALGMSADGIYGHRMKYGYFRESHREAKEVPLTQDNLEIILGMMMGDANMQRYNKNARMSIAHSPKQKEYIDYIADKLGNLGYYRHYYISKPHPKTGKCYESYWIEFNTNPAFNPIYEHFYHNGVKRIPIELFNNFTWQSLAYMFMDDGSKVACGGQLATNCFTVEDLTKFQSFLKEKFNIDTTICKSHVLYIKAKSFRLMKSKIEPYMCECTKYKIR